MRTKMILRVVSKALIPFILLFGLYVQLHGDFGPGGGFQAGVILASGMVLYGLIFNFKALEAVLRRRMVEQLIAIGVLLYGGVGVASMVLSGNFLEYGVFDSHDPKHGQHVGILLVELGVGITVTATMLAIFYAFAYRERRKRRRLEEARRLLAQGQVATEPEV